MLNTKCKDCPPKSRRKATYPGPRCYTHHKAVQKQRKGDAHGRRIGETYNITAEQFQQLYEFQQGLCGVCGKPMRRQNPRPSVDHDHECCNGPTSCGQCVRGLCHRYCNKLLGYWHDEPERFRRAADYLENPPAHAVIPRGTE